MTQKSAVLRCDLEASGCEMWYSDHPFSSSGQQSSSGRSYGSERKSSVCIAENEVSAAVVKCDCWLEHSAVRRVEYVSVSSKRTQQSIGTIWYTIYDTCIYCSWVSTRWQRSVDLYKNRKDTAIYAKGETINKTIQKHRIIKIETKYTKREIKHKKY
jgi:hypothetical protein